VLQAVVAVAPGRTGVPNGHGPRAADQAEVADAADDRRQQRLRAAVGDHAERHGGCGGAEARQRRQVGPLDHAGAAGADRHRGEHVGDPEGDEQPVDAGCVTERREEAPQ
jgi:hypothetical protein